MKAEFLKRAKVKSEQEFYSKYPNPEAFFKAFPDMKKYQLGGPPEVNLPELPSGHGEENFKQPLEVMNYTFKRGLEDGMTNKEIQKLLKGNPEDNPYYLEMTQGLEQGYGEDHIKGSVVDFLQYSKRNVPRFGAKKVLQAAQGKREAYLPGRTIPGDVESNDIINLGTDTTEIQVEPQDFTQHVFSVPDSHNETEIPVFENGQTSDYSTSKTFAEAFRKARKDLGPGATFTWKGKQYGTQLKGEAVKPKSIDAGTMGQQYAKNQYERGGQTMQEFFDIGMIPAGPTAFYQEGGFTKANKDYFERGNVADLDDVRVNAAYAKNYYQSLYKKPLEKRNPQLSDAELLQMIEDITYNDNRALKERLKKPIYKDNRVDVDAVTYEFGGECPECDEMKKGGWIKEATDSIKRRGTEGVCTGSKFGSSSCPPGSKRYNLAKTFRKMNKKEEGGENIFRDTEDFVLDRKNNLMTAIQDNVNDVIYNDVSTELDEIPMAQYGGYPNPYYGYGFVPGYAPYYPQVSPAMMKLKSKSNLPEGFDFSKVNPKSFKGTQKGFSLPFGIGWGKTSFTMDFNPQAEQIQQNNTSPSIPNNYIPGRSMGYYGTPKGFMDIANKLQGLSEEDLASLYAQENRLGKHKCGGVKKAQDGFEVSDSYMTFDPNAFLRDTNQLSSWMEMGDFNNKQSQMQDMQIGSNLFPTVPGGDRGSYEQTGAGYGQFRPNQKVPVQFGNPSSMYEVGGEYELSDEQIQEILRNGGSVEYI